MTKIAIAALVIVGATYVLVWTPLVRAVTSVVVDEYYSYKTVCGDGFCLTVVYASHASINSEVRTYLYLGDVRPIPLFNRNFMLFEDGTDLCFRRGGDEQVEVLASTAPLENHLLGQAEVIPSADIGATCGLSTY